MSVRWIVLEKLPKSFEKYLHQTFDQVYEPSSPHSSIFQDMTPDRCLMI